VNPAPSKYSAIKAIRFDKLNKTGDGSLKKENRTRDLRFNELNKKEGAG